jgi:hypothetical protein
MEIMSATLATSTAPASPDRDPPHASPRIGPRLPRGRGRGAWSLALAALGLGAIALVWGRCALPAASFVRGHVGDVAATMLTYALAASLTARRTVRAAIAFAVALAIELTQALHDGVGGLAGELVLGASFDPWDLVAYAAGIGVAIAWTDPPRRRSPPARSPR